MNFKKVINTIGDFFKKMGKRNLIIAGAVIMIGLAVYVNWIIFAGDNKPFLRFTGAPYWVPEVRFKGQPLQTVVENIRMQAAWIKDMEIEAFGEGDVYPRSRFNVPAAYSELYDMALMTEDIANLKYYYAYGFPHDFESRASAIPPHRHIKTQMLTCNNIPQTV